MTAILTALGALLVLIALRDIFDTLFHPHGRGVVSQGVIRGVWRAAKTVARGNHAGLSFAGPVAFISVIAAWGALVTLGFALIVWPHLSEGFAFAAGLEAAEHDGFLDAVYVSMVNLTSLGYGDIVPTGSLLRLLGPLETLIGLGLLTASISWILLLYRVLADYRALSHEISILIEAERKSGTGLEEIEPGSAAETLSDLTSRVLALRDDLVHSQIAYYFHPRDGRHALPVLLPRLMEVVESCRQPERDPAVRFQATMLATALDDLLGTIAEDLARSPARDSREALAAYRRDHLWETGRTRVCG
jgi:Ion channel